jgi:chitin synthase
LTILSTSFPPSVQTVLGNNDISGKDITDIWKAAAKSNPTDFKNAIYCMNHMVYIGTVDNRNNFQCAFATALLLGSTIILCSVIGIKFLAALQFGLRKEPEEADKFVICMVPCYTEGPESLTKTLESVATLRYDDKRKLLFVICDGMIIGAGNDRPTPRIVLDILGVDETQDPEPLAFQSLGEGNRQFNMGKIYSGLYECRGHAVPFVVVVKVGSRTERVKPGNRGKRDSQLVLMRFLNRVHFNAEFAPMELEMYHHMRNIIGVSPSFYEFAFFVDADTEVEPSALNRMVSVMVHDAKVMGLCGETRISNEKESWVTYIQVYEYFISHHLAKAFESLFGTVTCLPGCFTMYRIRSPTKNVPLFASPSILADYAENNVDTLHVKNLLHLGEVNFYSFRIVT